jgi:hypothetical protein
VVIEAGMTVYASYDFVNLIILKRKKKEGEKNKINKAYQQNNFLVMNSISNKRVFFCLFVFFFFI